MRLGRWLYHHDRSVPQSANFQVKNAAVRITAYISDPTLEAPLQFFVGDGPGDSDGRWEYWARAGRRIAFGAGKLTQLVIAQAGYYRVDTRALEAAGVPAMIWLEDEERTVDDKTIPVHIIRPHCDAPNALTITSPVLVTCEQLAVMAASGQVIPSQWYGVVDVAPSIDPDQIFYVLGAREDTVPTEGVLYAPSVFGRNLVPATISGPPCRLVRIFDSVNANLFVGYDTISSWNWANRQARENEFRAVVFAAVDERTEIIRSTFVGGTVELEASTIADTDLIDVTASISSTTLSDSRIHGSIVRLVESGVSGAVSVGDTTISFSQCSVSDWRSSSSFVDAVSCSLQSVELRGSRCRWSSAKNVDLQVYWSSIETSPGVALQSWHVQSASVRLDHGSSAAFYFNHEYKNALVYVIDPASVNISCRSWTVHHGQVYAGLIQPNTTMPPAVNGLRVVHSVLRLYGLGVIETLRVEDSPIVDVSADASVTTLLPRMYMRRVSVEKSSVYFYFNRTGLSGAWLDLQNVRIAGNSAVRTWYGETVWRDVFLSNCQVIDFGNPFATNNWRFIDVHADGARFYALNPQSRDLISNLNAVNLDGGYVSYWGAGEHFMSNVTGQHTGFIHQDSNRVSISRCTGDYGAFYFRYAVNCRVYYCSVFPRGTLSMLGPDLYASRCHVFGYMSMSASSATNQANMTCDGILVGPMVTLAVGPDSTTPGTASLLASEFFGRGWFHFTFTAPVTASGLYAHGDNGTVIQTFNANVISAPHRNF